MPATSPRSPAPDPNRAAPSGARPHGWARRLKSIAFFAFIASVVAALAGALLLGVAIALAYPKLPDVTSLSDYRPKLPVRVYARGGELIGEFGEERRNLTPFANIPPLMINAVLAIEDERFFEHGGVDLRGVARAALANVFNPLSQGASTISMQVARNMFLTKDRTFLRKFYEVLLTFKLERLLSKEEILEIYMNQIFLGHRSFGFAAAAQTYFGKSLAELSVAEAAMLAGLPKAPSAFNP
ncbi:MAG: transglycosylase domain-containing protein, partial [Serpentinimonas sp.]|nr:transglycosylase domain-containing protein [Serpentinimonas sp.]